MHVGLGRRWLNGHVFVLFLLDDDQGIFVEIGLEELALDLLLTVLTATDWDHFEIGEKIELAFL